MFYEKSNGHRETKSSTREKLMHTLESYIRNKEPRIIPPLPVMSLCRGPFLTITGGGGKCPLPLWLVIKMFFLMAIAIHEGTTQHTVSDVLLSPWIQKKESGAKERQCQRPRP